LNNNPFIGECGLFEDEIMTLFAKALPGLVQFNGKDMTGFDVDDQVSDS